MESGFERERPIYLQIMERIKSRILSGIYQPGEKLPSVRELAVEMSVNPNTMQKAMAELEREALVFSKRTAGRYISEDETLLSDLKEETIRREAQAFMKRLKAQGISREEMIAALKAAGEEAEV